MIFAIPPRMGQTLIAGHKSLLTKLLINPVGSTLLRNRSKRNLVALIKPVDYLKILI